MATNDSFPSGTHPVPEEPTDADNDTATGCIDPKNLLQEANALTLFIARRGNMLNNDSERIAAYERLRKAVDDACDKGNYDFVALLGAYSEVSSFTYEEHGVNGRTILDTDGQGVRKLLMKERAKTGGCWKRLKYWLRKPRNRPLLIGSFLLVVIMIYEGLLQFWFDGTPVEADLKEAKELLVPLAWGALGTCTFLMKRLSDRLSAFAYEEARARGMEARIFLGAILALVVVEFVGLKDSPKPDVTQTVIAALKEAGFTPTAQSG